MMRRALRNVMLRKFGPGIPEYTTREQLSARLQFLRERGRHAEAHTFCEAWLAAVKFEEVLR